MAKVSLWTRQDLRFLEVLKNEGVFRVKKQYIEEKNEELAPYFLMLYHWFVQEASKIVPKPEKVQYPIWCSVHSDYMLRGAHGNVVIELSIDEQRVVYFDSAKWDLVLNHHYIAQDEQDQQLFDSELLKRGIANNFLLLDEHYRKFYPDLAQKVMNSWTRIFDVDKNNSNIFAVQANIWEIYPQDIVQILEGVEQQKIILPFPNKDWDM